MSEQTQPEQSDFPRADVGEAGPLLGRPQIIGLCSEHGWWFEQKREEESCPQGGCMARVEVYHWAHAYAPEDSRS